jgi:hypothetical protein
MVTGVTFNYQAPEIQVQDRRRVGVSDPGTGQLQVRAPVVVNNSDDMLGNLASSLAGTAMNFTNQAFGIQIEREYADGAAAAGVVQSEEALQTNPLTKDWKVAGYRDATSKYALADAEADFNFNLKQGKMLREKDPAEIQAYLQQRRDALMPTISGMSGEARTQAMAKLMLMDRSAITQHLAEHTKYIIDYKAQAQGAALNTQLGVLTSLRAQVVAGQSDERVYQDKLESVALSTALDIWDDNSLPYEAKQQMTYASLEAALRTDNIDLYTMMDTALTGNTELPDSRNGISNLTQRLQPEDQNKLANMYREAKARNKGIWSANFLMDSAKMESDMDAGTYTGSVVEGERFYRAGLANGSISGSEFQTKLNKLYDWAHKQEGNAGLARAYLAGDANAIRNMGKTETDALEALQKMNKGASQEMRIRTLMDAGRYWGSAYKEAGKAVSQSLNAAMAPNSPMAPQHKETLNTMLKMVDENEKLGFGNTRAAMLSGMDDNSKLRFERIVGYVREGQTIEGAIATVQARETREAAIGPTARAAAATKLQNELGTKIDSLSAIGDIRAGGLHISALWNPADAARLQSAPRDGVFNSNESLFSNSDTVRFYERAFKDEVRAEASHQQIVGYADTADSVYNRALAGVAARTIKTDSGPVFLPRGFDTQTVFGTSGGNTSAIGPAIDKIIAAAPMSGKAGMRYRVQFAQGRLQAQAFDSNGVPAGDLLQITPDMIRTSMGLKAKEATQRNSEVYGPGKVVRDEAGTSIKYNGSNNAAVQDSWMLDFRDNLVNHEGFRSTAYKDLSGKVVDGKPVETVGVGVSSHNPFYPKAGPDGKFTAESLQQAFIGASNSAAKAGRQYMEDVGLESKNWFLLFSEMSYQAGNNWLNQGGKAGQAYNTFIAHAQSGNVDNAVEAFKRTPAYFWSGNPKDRTQETPRQKKYLATLINAMKGN